MRHYIKHWRIINRHYTEKIIIQQFDYYIIIIAFSGDSVSRWYKCTVDTCFDIMNI